MKVTAFLLFDDEHTQISFMMPTKHFNSSAMPFCMLLIAVSSLFGQHQTETFSPVLTDGSLPYQIEINQFNLGEATLPTLHSYAKAQFDGKWLLLGGRTNGLHEFTQNGFVNFPASFQNREVWVIDPATGESWRRSLDDVESGLTTEVVESLAVTNNQFYQSDEQLYITGGYGLFNEFDYVTFDTLTAVDVPGMVEWVQGGSGVAADSIRQIHDPLFTVTGGAMLPIDGRTHLVFGQNFQGAYTPFGNGVYTNQVRSFDIVDDGQNLSIENVSSSAPDENYRRRDLNVMPTIRAGEGQSMVEGITALSGVFTPGGGAWTVPVEIDAGGNPQMASPSEATTFRQAMNTYHSAKLGLYSESAKDMHMLLFGGISLNFYDEASDEIVRDDFLPFIDQSTSIVVDEDGNYTQHLLPNTFPEILDEDSGKQLLLGTNAEFMLAPGIEIYQNGVIKMDELAEPTVLGHILGGIAADQPNRGNTAASGRIFEVVFTPTSYFDCNADDVIDRLDLECANQFDILDGVLQQTGLPRGDIDGNGEVAFADFLILSQNFGQQLEFYTLGDLDGDGAVAFADFLILSQNYGETSKRIENVPEPESTWFILGSLLLLLFRDAGPRSKTWAH